ncbi:MAG: hypothetical protein MJ224_02050 [archaeon]|nr:hypothetical protein [archaeon]
MTKISKDELITKVNEKISDVDLAIELIEDITDSMDIPDTTELDNVKAELETLKQKYKDRFMSSNEASEEKEENPEMEEKEVIDIKEI